MSERDPATFYQQALVTAQANLTYVEGTDRVSAMRQAAREALQEAHSSLGQAAFFAALDALGGQQTVLERLERDLRDPTWPASP